MVAVERAYAGLMQASEAAPGQGQEPSLGGRLFYAGGLDEAGRALVAAGNTAGAASLVAAAEPGAQKQGIRDGIVDFLVTSLDEALRILKNEIRKGEAVAVCVGADPNAVEREMRERGVAPDLLAAGSAGELRGAAFAGARAKWIEPAGTSEGRVLLAWQVAGAQAAWMRKLDAMAADCVGPEDWVARRWLRLAPRYLGRLTQGVRVLRCDPRIAEEFTARVQDGMHRGVIDAEVSIRRIGDDETLADPLRPGADSTGAD